MHTVKHIFFDLDRTLWDFETNSRIVIGDLFTEYNLESRCNACLSEFLQCYEEINLKLWDDLRGGKITKQQLRSSRFYNAMNAFGYNDYDTAFQMEEEYIKRSPYQKTLMPGALELLEHLNRKYKLHIITNGFKEVQYIKLEHSGLRSYFDKIIISEEVGSAKPERGIFEKAMNAAGCTAAESLMIGDDIEADIKGALSAGMKAIHFDPRKANDKNENFLKADSLSAIRVIL